MSDHEEMEGAIAAWVLGALDPEEAEATRLHVEGCPSCRLTVARLSRAAASLPLEVEEIPPPPRLRERVLVAAAAARTSSVPYAPARKRVGPVARPWKPAAFQLGYRTVLTAAAAVVLALLIGLAAGDLIGRNSVPPVTSQVVRFTLVGHGPLAAARGTVIDLKSDGVALVDFNKLPALDKGKVYQVWLITPGGHPDSVGVFVPDSNGSKVVLVNVPLNGYAQIAVTTEDGPDGAQAPTQQPQLYGALG